MNTFLCIYRQLANVDLADYKGITPLAIRSRLETFYFDPVVQRRAEYRPTFARNVQTSTSCV